uniref:Uncharacterized protein n=1 Tax=Anopheles dirus TaxID=7168 RepID=A0A182NV22_9DIPT
NFGVLTTQNGYKGGSFTTDSNIGSPARRSEVSPIQSHTTSRRGWHSPNQDSVPISPKSDHYPVHHRIHNGQAPDGGAQHSKNLYGAVNGQSGPASFHQLHHQQQYSPRLSSPKSISRNGSSYTLESGTTNVYYSKSVDSFAADGTLPYAMPEFDFHAGNTGPSRGIMTGTGSVSTGHNGHLMSHSAIGTRGNYSTVTSSSNELLEELHSLEGARIKRLHPATARISSSSSSSVNSNHYNVNNNNNHLAGAALSSHSGSSDGHHLQAQTSTTGENTSSKNGSPLPARGASVCSSPVSRSTASLGKTNRIINGNNNNNNNSIHFDASVSGAGRAGLGGSSLTTSFTNKFHKLTGNRSTSSSNVPERGSSSNASSSKLNHVNNNNSTTVTTGTGVIPYHPHHQQYQINNVTTHLHPPPAQPLPPGKQPPSSSSSSSSPPPPAQPAAPQPGAHAPTPTSSVHHLHHPSTHGHHHHHPHGPMGHTLSSPESAYSTGYSTDGTS